MEGKMREKNQLELDEEEIKERIKEYLVGFRIQGQEEVGKAIDNALSYEVIKIDFDVKGVKFKRKIMVVMGMLKEIEE